MVSRDKALKALRALLHQPVDYDKTPGELFSPGFIYGDTTKDRAAVLVAATLLDQFLKTAILTRLITLNSEEDDALFGASDNSPLSSFSARIKIGYALGIYDRKFRHDLDMIRAIRNVFAHAHGHVDFDTPAVVNGCALLDRPSKSDLMWNTLYAENPTARNRYIFTTMMCSLILVATQRPEKSAAPS